MSEGGMVENEDVGESGKDEVKHKTEKPRGVVRKLCRFMAQDDWSVPCNQIKAQELPAYIVPPPFTHVRISRRGELEELGGWVYWGRQLTHTGKSCSSIFEIIF